jgi:hypothetical protein
MATTHNDSPDRPIVGWFLAAIALVVLVLAWAEKLDPLASMTFGVTLGDNGQGAYVAAVLPGSASDRQGIKVGDLVDVRALTTSSRFRLAVGSPPGTQVTLRIGHNGSWRDVAVTAGPKPESGVTFITTIGATITLLVVALIGYRRPSLATAALVWYGCGSVTTFGMTALFSRLPDPWFGGAAVFIVAALSQLPVFALFPFIARFPNLPTSRPARVRMHIADGLFLAAVVFFTVQTIFEPVTFISWSFFLNDIVGVGSTVLVLVFTLLAYRDESGESRRRIGWVIFGLLVSDVAYNVFDALTTAGLLGLTPSLKVAEQVAGSLQVALPVALAYAVLRHRVLDIGFALNRGVVYAVLTTIIICVVGLVDWLTSRLLNQERLALAIEAVATILVGVSLNWLHGRVERIVDQTVFRKRHVAERRIEHRIEALRFAATDSSIDDALAGDAPEILDLASAAVFRRVVSGGPFLRIAAHGWGDSDVDAVDPDSLLVRTILAVERSIILADLAISHPGMPHGSATPVLAIPINAQHELLGFALFGNDREGGSLDPTQISLLARLVNAASNAYGVVEARRWRARAAELEGVLPMMSPAVAD